MIPIRTRRHITMPAVTLHPPTTVSYVTWPCVHASNSGVGARCIVHRTSCHIPASHTRGSCPSISSASVQTMGKTDASVLTPLPTVDCSPAVGAGTASLGQTVEHTTGKRHHSHHDRLTEFNHIYNNLASQ